MSREDLVGAYLDGSISRRTFVRRLVAAGVSLTAALTYVQMRPELARAAQSRGYGHYGHYGHYCHYGTRSSPAPVSPAAPGSSGSPASPGSSKHSSGSRRRHHHHKRHHRGR